MPGLDSPIGHVLDDAKSEMRAPTGFLGFTEAISRALDNLSKDQKRELGVYTRGRGRQAEQEQRQETARALAEEGNLILVFDGSGSELDFVTGDESRRMRGAVLITDPIPAELPLDKDDTLYFIREGQQVQGGWEVDEPSGFYMSAVQKLMIDPKDEKILELQNRVDELESEPEAERSQAEEEAE